MPDPIVISANGTTATLTLDLITAYKLSLRGATLDAGIEVVFEYADIGQTNWRPLFVGPETDDPRVKLNSKFQDILISGDCLLRAVITGFGTSNTVTITAKMKPGLKVEEADLENQKRDLSNQKSRLVSEKKEYDNLVTQYEAQLNELNSLESQKQAEINSLSQKEKDVLNEINSYNEDNANLKDYINNLINEEKNKEESNGSGGGSISDGGSSSTDGGGS